MTDVVYMYLTDNCNVQCSHCYRSCGPGKKETTITTKNFKKILSNLPQDQFCLTLGGGEFFSIGNRAWEILKLTKDENERREKEKIEEISVNVQTNGLWGKSEKRTKEIFEKLKKYGVKEISIASDDNFHVEQGIKTEYIERIKSIRGDYGIFVYTCGAGPIIPMGRALDNSDLVAVRTWRQECLNWLSGRYFFVEPNGDTKVCCFGIKPVVGNLTENSLEEIISKGKENKRLVALNENGLRGVLKYDGKLEDYEKLIQDYGECVACSLINKD